MNILYLFIFLMTACTDPFDTSSDFNRRNIILNRAKGSTVSLDIDWNAFRSSRSTIIKDDEFQEIKEFIYQFYSGSFNSIDLSLIKEMRNEREQRYIEVEYYINGASREKLPHSMRGTFGRVGLVLLENELKSKNSNFVEVSKDVYKIVFPNTDDEGNNEHLKLLGHFMFQTRVILFTEGDSLKAVFGIEIKKKTAEKEFISLMKGEI